VLGRTIGRCSCCVSGPKFVSCVPSPSSFPFRVAVPFSGPHSSCARRFLSHICTAIPHWPVFFLCLHAESRYYSVDPTPAAPAATPLPQLRSSLLNEEEAIFERCARAKAG